MKFAMTHDNPIVPGLILALACALTTTMLLTVMQLTAPTIALRLKEDQMSGLNQVMPAERYDNDLLLTQTTLTVSQQRYQVFTALHENGQVNGYAIQFSAQGYAGPITLVMGLDASLTILNVRVLNHTETPGLGDKIEIAKDDWINSFAGLSLLNVPAEQWQVAKDGGQFDQFTGATITPRAIVQRVHSALQDMRVILSQLTGDAQ